MKKSLFEKVEKLKNSVKGVLVEKRILYNGNFINLFSEKYEFPNKKIIHRECINKNNNKESVIIIAITKDNKFLLICQNRINNIVSLEFPAGYIEEGENISEASIRELEEETGYTSSDIVLLDSYNASLGIDSSVVNIVIANDCRKTKNQSLGDNEYISFDTFTFEELRALINEKIITGGGNRLAFFEYKNLLSKFNFTQI